jgi:hypothetical protein
MPTRCRAGSRRSSNGTACRPVIVVPAMMFVSAAPAPRKFGRHMGNEFLVDARR